MITQEMGLHPGGGALLGELVTACGGSIIECSPITLPGRVYKTHPGKERSLFSSAIPRNTFLSSVHVHHVILPDTSVVELYCRWRAFRTLCIEVSVYGDTSRELRK